MFFFALGSLTRDIVLSLIYFFRELDQSKVKLGGILNLSVQDLQQMEEKAKKYENELLKFEVGFRLIGGINTNQTFYLEKIPLVKRPRDQPSKYY